MAGKLLVYLFLKENPSGRETNKMYANINTVSSGYDKIVILSPKDLHSKGKITTLISSPEYLKKEPIQPILDFADDFEMTSITFLHHETLTEESNFPWKHEELKKLYNEHKDKLPESRKRSSSRDKE